MKSSAANIQGITNVLYVAFELCTKGSWKLAFTTGMGQKPRMRNVSPGNTDAVRAEIARAKKRFGLPDDCRVISCYEAGRDGFWIHRFLESEGVENLVVDSSSIEVNRRKRRTKTDRLDAAKLVTMLIRWNEGEKKVWSVVHVPSDEAEDDRHLERELAALKTDRTRIVHRIKSLLTTQGVKVKAIDETFKYQLQKERRWDGTPLRKGLVNRLLLEYERLLLARAQISAIEKERRRLLKESEGPASQAARKLSFENAGPGVATQAFAW